LFEKNIVRQLIETVSPLLCHPCLSIRFATIAFIAAAADPKNKLFSFLETHVLIMPCLAPFLKIRFEEITEATLLGFCTPTLFFSTHLAFLH